MAFWRPFLFYFRRKAFWAGPSARFWDTRPCQAVTGWGGPRSRSGSFGTVFHYFLRTNYLLNVATKSWPIFVWDKLKWALLSGLSSSPKATARHSKRALPFLGPCRASFWTGRAPGGDRLHSPLNTYLIAYMFEARTQNRCRISKRICMLLDDLVETILGNEG